MSEFEPEIRDFVARYINSVSRLELLLLMRSRPGESASADELARELYSTTPATAAQLTDLVTLGFLAQEPGGQMRFVYAPKSSELDRLAGRLADLYRERRAAVITMIYSDPDQAARTFADAFRLRKREE